MSDWEEDAVDSCAVESCHKDCFTHLNLNIKYITRFGSMGTVKNKGERIVSWKDPWLSGAIPTHSFLSHSLLVFWQRWSFWMRCSSLGMKNNEEYLCVVKRRGPRKAFQSRSVLSSFCLSTLDFRLWESWVIPPLPLIFFLKLYLNIFSLLSNHLDSVNKVKVHLVNPAFPGVTTLLLRALPDLSSTHWLLFYVSVTFILCSHSDTLIKSKVVQTVAHLCGAAGNKGEGDSTYLYKYVLRVTVE